MKSCETCVNYRPDIGRVFTVRCIIKSVAKKDEADRCQYYEVKK
jgi:hypothetical protein